MPTAYLDCLDFLFSRLNYERSGMPRSIAELRIGRMRRLLKLLDDPHHGLPIIHVAGTKGKGSTSALIAAALSASGAHTGLFCSPHLHRLEERYQVDGTTISPEQLVSLVEAVRPAVDAIDSSHFDAAERPLTFFEITTAMGLLHFARQNCRAVVLEVGLGGRLDSTNVVRPAVAVITSISFDHTKLLGNTLAAIATEKAGILKRRGTAVCGVRNPEARSAIEHVAGQRHAHVRYIDDDYQLAYSPPTLPLAGPTPGTLRVNTWRRAWAPKMLPLLGAHQARNAATALAALDALAEVQPNLEVRDEHVEAGWHALRFPARVEVVDSHPWFIVDSAHNVASARALAETLTTHFPATPRTLIFGTTKDKDLTGQLAPLLPLFDHVVATRYLENPRAVPSTDIEDAVRSLGNVSVVRTDSPAEAIELARQITPSNGLICASGSLFLASEIRAILLKLPDDLAVQAIEPAEGR